MRERRDEEVEPALERLFQASLQVVAHVDLEPGVVAVPEVRSPGERHGRRALAREWCVSWRRATIRFIRSGELSA
jgi:hypothetical protein